MSTIRTVTSFSAEAQVRATQLARIDADRLSDLDFFERSCRAFPSPDLVAKYRRLRAVGLMNLGIILRAEGVEPGEHVDLAGRRYTLGYTGTAMYEGPSPCPEDDEDDFTRDDETREWASHYTDGIRVG